MKHIKGTRMPTEAPEIEYLQGSQRITLNAAWAPDCGLGTSPLGHVSSGQGTFIAARAHL